MEKKISGLKKYQMLMKKSNDVQDKTSKWKYKLQNLTVKRKIECLKKH